MEKITDIARYNSRMGITAPDKLRAAAYIDPEAKHILDVGTANGFTTCILAEMFPDAHVTGVDLDPEFIKLAQQHAKAKGLTNVTFRQVYLRDLLAEPQCFDAVLFISVLHEFFSYGEGISSVMKAVADAHELLKYGGVLCIRDMMVHEHAIRVRAVHDLALCVSAKREYAPLLSDFVERYGPLEDLRNVTHFLLKYLYGDNWAHEMGENYLGVTVEQYQQLLEAMLGMELLTVQTYLIPYLRQRWEDDFGLPEVELDRLSSTGIITARKQSAPQGMRVN
jgi:SAM-dependent methyltransferase